MFKSWTTFTDVFTADCNSFYEKSFKIDKNKIIIERIDNQNDISFPPDKISIIIQNMNAIEYIKSSELFTKDYHQFTISQMILNDGI